MASFVDRLLGREKREATTSLVVPTRSSVVGTPDEALTLTPVYRALSIIATPVSKMKLETYRFAGGVEQKIENPLFVNSPSLLLSRRELLAQTCNDLSLWGNAYWLKSFDTQGRINSVEILPAADVLVEQDPTTGVIRYVYNNKI